VFQRSKPTEGIRLLQWNKELPSASAADPLGLNLRVSARLSDELLYCITSVTPRARYYAFFPWAFQDYNEQERSTRTDRGRIKGVLVRERAMVLGAVLHHNGHPCDGGALGGSEKATKIDLKRRRSFDLSRWEHLGAAEGQFGAAYKGSLINMGVFETDNERVKDEAEAETAELDKETQDIEVRELSNLGKRLATAFGQSVRGTAYVKQKWTLRDSVDTDILTEFGSRAGLCEIAKKWADDRDVLRDAFFAKYKEMDRPGQHRRRMSLLLLLECVGQAHAAGALFGNSSFSDACYFGMFVSDADTPEKTPVNVPPQLADIYERWRIFYSQNYLAVALQSILVACVRVLRNRPGGMPYEHLIQGLNPPSLNARFREVFGRELPEDFFALSARETLTLCGIGGKHPVNILPIDAPFSERTLEHILIESEANDAASVPLAAMLMYEVVLRYGQRVSAAHNNWYAQQIYNTAADIALPEIAKFLVHEFGDGWLDHSNEQILRRVVWRFVIRQHQTMSYERGFGGSAPLFHVDGTTIIGAGTDFTDPRALNPRLGSALQILSDLGLITYEDDIGYKRTPEGNDWLAAEVGHEVTP
jgi:hypothetical protein